MNIPLNETLNVIISEFSLFVWLTSQCIWILPYGNKVGALGLWIPWNVSLTWVIPLPNMKWHQLCRNKILSTSGLHAFISGCVKHVLLSSVWYLGKKMWYTKMWYKKMWYKTFYSLSMNQSCDILRHSRLFLEGIRLTAESAYVINSNCCTCIMCQNSIMSIPVSGYINFKP